MWVVTDLRYKDTKPARKVQWASSPFGHLVGVVKSVRYQIVNRQAAQFCFFSHKGLNCFCEALRLDCCCPEVGDKRIQPILPSPEKKGPGRKHPVGAGELSVLSSAQKDKFLCRHVVACAEPANVHTTCSARCIPFNDVCAGFLWCIDERRDLPSQQIQYL